MAFDSLADDYYSRRVVILTRIQDYDCEKHAYAEEGSLSTKAGFIGMRSLSRVVGTDIDHDSAALSG